MDTVMASRSYKEIQGKRQSTVGRRKMPIRLAVAITLPSADDIRVTFQLRQRLGLRAAHPVYPCPSPSIEETSTLKVAVRRHGCCGPRTIASDYKHGSATFRRHCI